MIIAGWGNNNIIRSDIFYPKNEQEIIEILEKLNNEGIITRGLGRSYGDMSLYKNILSLEKYKKFFELDEKTGILRCSSNLSIVEILEKIVNKGWFLNVTPGSKYVTIGGAIANDVHGKNHHKDGSFSEYVEEIKIITPDGKINICSNKFEYDLFKATCGGAGLTGVIVSAKLKLLKIKSKNLNVTIFKTKSIDETLKKFREFNENKYLVAWLDTINKKNFGKAVIFSGDHSEDNDLNLKLKKGFNLPSFMGSLFMNNFFVSIFNKFYFLKHKNNFKVKQDIDTFFYPLDRVLNWNKFYGKKGFTQIQILIKDEDKYKEILIKILDFFIKKNIYSYLTTLKEYGQGNNNYLSFAEKGLSVTLDIPLKNGFLIIYEEFENILLNQNVKIYLAKDSFMSKDFFYKSYDKINKFINFKKKIDPSSKFKSIQSQRLGL